jgi:two-component system phosphate regulon sensor histidine kinase PhoR
MIVDFFYMVFWACLSAMVGAVLKGSTGAILGAATACLLCALLHIWRARKLDAWLRKPETPAPRLSGLWGNLVHRVVRLLKQRDQHIQQQADRLRYFLEAIQASPNGVTLLDEQGRIEWCNDVAGRHLGLDARRDHLQPVVHLVRDPVFSRYFSQPDHRQELSMEGRSSSMAQRIQLSVQLFPYGAGQQMLLTRDVTAILQAETMRRDFVANVSHEIRTPLTVLSGFVETLQSIPLEDAERQRYLGLMALQAERMQTLVSDLLTLSTLEGSPPPGMSEQVKLPELMASVEADARALSTVLSKDPQTPAHDLVFEPSPDWTLLAARSELVSAVTNLVNNAVRYTPPGGRITVMWRATDEQVRFSVEDTGPGIAPEHLPRLSERFYRVDRSRSRETGGTGLGLAIAKHVAQRHGGELRIESQLGQGSTFSLCFPVSRVIRP